MRTRSGTSWGVLAVLLLFLAGGLVWNATNRSQTPSYGGKSVRTWIKEIREQERFERPPHTEARAAIKALGLEALPYLFDAVDRRSIPYWERLLRTAYRRFPSIVPEPPLRLEYPELIPYLNFVALSCRQTFPQSVDLVLRATQSDQADVRVAALIALNGITNPIPDIVVAFVRRLEDQDRFVRYQAMVGLARFGPAASNAVPALIPVIGTPQSHLAAYALGAIGPASSAAVPPLRTLLVSSNSQVAVNAAIALWQITGVSTESIPILIQHRDAADISRRAYILERLAEMETNGLRPIQP
ncbi:MAG: HEAT repeat domain-containing protein [Verrucomicrobia bacterium]|nr:HEAT repeat domain-containing protein [Verrucomicrobiota bacterium]